MTAENIIKPIFSRNDVINKMAFLEWRMESGNILNLINLADGYFQSAIIQTESCLQNNTDKRADILIFPILMCFNHAIELYLKANILIFDKLLDNNFKTNGTHDLRQLYYTLRARIKDLNGSKDANQFEKDFTELSHYINELINKIQASPENDKMDFSRYPFGKNGGNHFYVDTLSNEIDLDNLLSRMKLLYDKFDTFTKDLYYERIEYE